MQREASCRVLVHAPNVHMGGGLVLLRELLLIRCPPFQWVQLDSRTQHHLAVAQGISVRYVRPFVISRILAEWRLWRECQLGDTVLCFHGLPPLFPLRGRVLVFVQNRLLIEQGSLAEYPFVVRTRLLVERLWGRAFQGRCSRYLVQSPSMAALLRRWLRHEVPISVAPFAAPAATTATSAPNALGQRFDFLYVASGEAHKNHRNLIEAWRLLAEAGHRPSLALTLDVDVHAGLCRHIGQLATQHGLAVVNLGALPGDAVEALYRSAGAMIYPSTSESLGLPLIEAARLGLPILASELDFVRDVIDPVESFDPNSPVSIARAVKRFLGVAERPVRIGTATEFLAEVVR